MIKDNINFLAELLKKRVGAGESRQLALVTLSPFSTLTESHTSN